MAMNPYEVLGVSENASLDEVKKAYRKKARENHPDLNPNDPTAAERIKQINEAYDRIANPEKYAREHMAAPGGGTPYQGPTAYGWAWGPAPGGQNTRSGSGPGYTWTTTTFTWDEIFGPGWANAAASDPSSIHPEASAEDSPEVREAIAAMNAGDYAAAVAKLGSVPRLKRNARWYYLSSLANYGYGSTTLAFDQIRKARRMDPANMDYLRAHQAFQQPGTAYTEAGQSFGFGTGGTNCASCCCGLMIAQSLCYPIALCC